MLKKSDELSDACRGFFERLKTHLKENDTDVFCSREVRSALRVSLSKLGRYLYELERTGHVRIVKGNRYKGFKYRVQQWNDLEILSGDSRKLIERILNAIRSVTRNPRVTQPIGGLHKTQKTNGEGAVTHEG